MATQDLQRQIEEARAYGYSEEQIQEFLNPKPVQETALPPASGPVPPATTPYVDRSEEDTALLQYGAAKAAQGIGYGAAGKVALDTALKMAGRQPTPSITRGIGNVIQGAANMIRPTAPVVPPVEPLTDFVQQRGAYAPQAGQAPAQPAVGGPAAQQGSQFIQRMSALASKYAPVAKSLTGAGAMLYSPSLNTNEAEELRRLRGY